MSRSRGERAPRRFLANSGYELPATSQCVAPVWWLFKPLLGRIMQTAIRRFFQLSLVAVLFSCLPLAHAQADCGAYPSGITDTTMVLSFKPGGPSVWKATKVNAAGISANGVAGQFTYNSTNNTLQLCDGTNWVAVGGTSSQWTTATNDIYYNTGSVVVGGNTIADPTAVVDMRSTTKGFLPPRMTTTQRDAISSPAVGLVIFNTTTDKLNVHDSSGWIELSTGGSIDDTPNAFNFTDQTDVASNTVITSDVLTVSGLGTLPVAVSISGDGSPEVSIGGGAWVTAGILANGQTIQARLTSANAFLALSSATVDVGASNDQWNVTTVACGGTEVGGGCWYWGSSGASCTSTCSSHGGYSDLTRTYAGSSGSGANCKTVLDALNANTGQSSPTTSSDTGMGCFTYSAYRYWSTNATTEGAATGGRGRACACNG